MTMFRSQRFLFLLLVGIWDLAGAQNCMMPIPFQYQFQHAVTASLSAANPNDLCALSVATNPGAAATAAGFLHYQRASPLKFVRYGFRVDMSALSNFEGSFLQLRLFAATAPTNASTSVASPLQVWLEDGNQGQLLFSAAAAAPLGNLQQQTFDLAQPLSSVVIRVEISTGSGSNGSVRYWVNHAFADPPDGTIDNAGAGLDNANWLGVIGAEIGMSSTSSPFRASYAGKTLIFDQIESSDDVLFFDSFNGSIQ